MKNFIKYLIPIIIAFAFIDGVGESNSVDLKNSIGDLTTEFITGHVNFSIFDSVLHCSRQISSLNTLSQKSTSQRANNTHKHKFTFIKAGKVLNTGIINSSQNNSKFFYSSLIKPVHRLISFGKLII